MSNITVYKDNNANAIFIEDANGVQFINSLQASVPTTTVTITDLAKNIEIVSNQDYETFLNKQLFIPAGMKHTGYLIPAWDDNMLAIGYSRNVFERGSMVKKYQEKMIVDIHCKGSRTALFTTYISKMNTGAIGSHIR